MTDLRQLCATLLDDVRYLFEALQQGGVNPVRIAQIQNNWHKAHEALRPSPTSKVLAEPLTLEEIQAQKNAIILPNEYVVQLEGEFTKAELLEIAEVLKEEQQ